MRTTLFIGIGMALSAAVMAGPQGALDASSGDTRGDDPERCLVSFDSAQQNVCTGEVTLANPELKNLANVAAFKDSPLRLIKFDGPITEQRRAAVLAAGYEIVDYAPYNAFIVRAPAAWTGQRIAIDGVLWTGPFLPAFKVDVNLARQFAGVKIIEKAGVEELVVSLNRGTNGGAVQESIKRAPGLSFSKTMTTGDETRLLARFEQASLRAAVEQLAADPGVTAIGLRWPARLLNAEADWLHQSNVNSPSPLRPVFDRGIYGCGQIIGELDTGVHMANCAFKDASQATPLDACTSGTSCPTIASPNNDARKVVAYYKWSGLSGNSPADNDGHGTHVAGSIAGQNPANAVDCTTFTTPGGHTDLDGTAPGAKLVVQEAGGNLAYLNTHGGNPYHAADTAYTNGARLHSNSWGAGCVEFNEETQQNEYIPGCTVTYDENARDADKVMRDRTDLVLLFAAGNDGNIAPAGYNVGSPGNAKNVITVGATSRGTAANAMTDFSSRGPTNDARTKPDITAQGSRIVSAGRSACGTATMSGTSMATPTAAGLAALVREYLQRGFYPTGQKVAANAIANPSGALIKAILVAGAMPMTGTGTGTSPGQSQGWGRILLDDSLYFNGDGNKLYIHDAPTGLSTGGQDTHSLTVAAGQPLNVALVWTDVAAAVGANPALVNSLRLELVAPNGDVWTQKLPSGVSRSNANPTQSTGTTNYDNRNNVQRISFANPAAGTYTVRVRGINVPTGPQKYALAVTGIVSTEEGGNQAPVANFSNSASGLTVNFTDTSSDADGTIASRLWNFGDGTTSTATNPSKTYASARTYTVTLTVTDNAGAADTKTGTVTVSAPPGNTLTNGVPIAGLSAAKGVDKVYTLAVPAGASNLRFVTSGGDGDLDLYVKFGSAPTISVNDCKSEGSTNAETCSIATAQAGTYYVMLHAYAAYSGVSLTGNFTTGSGGTQTYSNTTDYAIRDNSTVESPITVTGRTGNAPSNAVVDVAIVHTYQGDLKVDLVAPDGTLYNIHNRSGGSADNINKRVTLNLSGETLNGTWKLRVNDNLTGYTGRIDSWSITF